MFKAGSLLRTKEIITCYKHKSGLDCKSFKENTIFLIIKDFDPQQYFEEMEFHIKNKIYYFPYDVDDGFLFEVL